MEREIFEDSNWNMSYEEYQLCYCPACEKEDCIHRNAFRRVPECDGGLALCPNLKAAKDSLAFSQIDQPLLDMDIPKVFRAIDKLNDNYLYSFVGYKNTETGYNIHLFNVTDQTDTYVEPEWFNQRKIVPLKDKNGILVLSAEDYATNVAPEGLLYYKRNEVFLIKGDTYILAAQNNSSGETTFLRGLKTIVVPTEKLGTFLPGIASEGLEIKNQK